MIKTSNEKKYALLFSVRCANLAAEDYPKSSLYFRIPFSLLNAVTKKIWCHHAQLTVAAAASSNKFAPSIRTRAK